ncbi:MAG: hypothetical protein OEL89_00400 [Candidatus Peregrinibacteria bacterium]|nr:hypothetical protein [Candidatus Peregrinibacteria bacterium]
MIKCNENMDHRWAIVSLKLAMISLTIVVLKVWTTAMTWVHNTNVWWFVAAFVIFAIKAGMTCGGSCCATNGSVAKKKTAKKKK